MDKTYEFVELQCPACGKQPLAVRLLARTEDAAIALRGLPRVIGMSFTFFTDFPGWMRAVTAKRGSIGVCLNCSKPVVLCPYCHKFNIFLHVHQKCTHCGNDYL